MTITVLFDVKCTAAQYDQVMKALDAAKATHPRGRLYHCSQPSGASWCVVDVWESAETFQEFGKTLIPILAKNGVAEPGMNIMPTHNIVRPPI